MPLYDKASEPPVDVEESSLTAASDDGTTSDTPASSPTDADQPVNSAIRAVTNHFAVHGLYVGADGDIRLEEPSAAAHAEIAEVSIVQPPSLQQLRDDLILSGITEKSSVLMAAIRRILRDGAHARQKTLIGSITTPLETEQDYATAVDGLTRFVSTAFEGDPEVSAAIILHFMHQVKRKFAKLPVSDHQMPVFVSAQQGVGKTIAVKRLLAPLAEMAKSVLFSDIADPRSIYVFRHPVLIMDDMEKLKSSEIPVVKNRVTGEEVIARGMQSNREVGTRQRATFIGTANESVMALVPDQSGHRRFFELTFRNANPATGGDPYIWDVVNSTDFLAIWRSVDPFDPSPLDIVRNKVFRIDGPPKPKSKVHAWALKLDPAGAALARVLGESLGAPSLKLYDLYCEETQDAWMSIKEFGILMREATKDPNVPFVWPKRSSGGIYFPLRKGRT